MKVWCLPAFVADIGFVALGLSFDFVNYTIAVVVVVAAEKKFNKGLIRAIEFTY